jgi:hypothetical protein
MSYGYGVPYDHYSPIEFAQPHPEPNPMLFVHPDSVVAQLRLTLEEIREVLVDQVRWMREEYPKEEAAHLPTTAQHQWDNNTSLPPPLPPTSNPIVCYTRATGQWTKPLKLSHHLTMT